MFWPTCKEEKARSSEERQWEGGREEGKEGGVCFGWGRPCREGANLGSANELLSPCEAGSFVWY